MKTFISKGFNSNTYIIERFDSVMIVDPSCSLEQINQLISGKKLVGILLTHGHIDHTTLIGQLSNKDCPVYIHESEINLLFDDYENGSSMLGIKRSYKKESLNIVTVKDNSVIQLIDKEIKVIYTPGHTKGSVCYLFDECLFTGDTLFKSSIGRTDFPSGNLRQMKDSLRRIFGTCKSSIKIYPGHDETSTIKEEMKTNEYYLNWVKVK